MNVRPYYNHTEAIQVSVGLDLLNILELVSYCFSMLMLCFCYVLLFLWRGVRCQVLPSVEPVERSLNVLPKFDKIVCQGLQNFLFVDDFYDIQHLVNTNWLQIGKIIAFKKVIFLAEWRGWGLGDVRHHHAVVARLPPGVELHSVCWRHGGQSAFQQSVEAWHRSI